MGATISAAEAANDVSSFTGVSGVVVAVLGVIVAVVVPLIVYRANHPRRLVSYRLDVSPQLHAAPAGSGPTSQAVLSVWCSGRADVPAARFDEKHQLVFRFGMRVAGMLEQDSTPSAWQFTLADEHEVHLGPIVIGRGTLMETHLLLEHPIAMTVWSPLVDTSVVESPAPSQVSATATRRRIGAIRAGLVVMLAGFSLYVLAIVLFAVSLTGGSPNIGVYTIATVVSLLAFVTVLGGIVTVVVGGVLRIRRALAMRSARPGER